jgi:hypothetical protein
MLDLKEPFIPQKLLRSGQWGSGALGGIFHSGELSAFIRGKIQRVTEPKQAKTDHQSSHVPRKWDAIVGIRIISVHISVSYTVKGR